MDGHRFVQYRLEVQSSGFKYLITNELGEILNKPTRYIVICDEKVEQSARKIFSQVSDFIVLKGFGKQFKQNKTQYLNRKVIIEYVSNNNFSKFEDFKIGESLVLKNLYFFPSDKQT